VARPSNPRGSAGRFIHPFGIPTHLNPRGDGTMADQQVIASDTKIVHDPALDIDRQVIAGQPVPPDLVDAYNDAGGSTTSTSAPAGAVDSSTAPSGEELTGDALQARASELDIKGRSKMDADELRAAIAQAEQQA
jgi:hypothetical protein